uniref:Uncharacterized protein n=1 Tax=Anguilla anguilla TaxID=7936 RepID=A0A0E9W929_ANGAN
MEWVKVASLFRMCSWSVRDTGRASGHLH